ncbi:MAG: pilus assembly protein [Burkholderiales bacterium RIFCSPLOWO2_02_FULL_57_36]|nr:MAG: pilus assembly protein [Burkholderiales bacterium RIFCSPLOWO2_02_FULL_57_36]
MRLCKQRGVSLVVSLLMLIAVMLLGLSATQIALQSEKASRNDRDRQIAFQAAEAGLLDAEMDIENSPDPARSRSIIFSREIAYAFTDGCGNGDANPFLGLCAHVADGAAPAWLTVDLLNDSPSAASVPFGKFTGQTFQVGEGSLPAKLPRYIIELMPYNGPGESAELSSRSYFYRITGIGFGMRDTTLVVLQTFYRKKD